MTHSSYTDKRFGGTVSLTLFRAEKAQAVEAEQQAAFDAYLKARDRAEMSRSLEDGIAAGKCWGRFMDMFVRRG